MVSKIHRSRCFNGNQNYTSKNQRDNKLILLKNLSDVQETLPALTFLFLENFDTWGKE